MKKIVFLYLTFCVTFLLFADRKNKEEASREIQSAAQEIQKAEALRMSNIESPSILGEAKFYLEKAKIQLEDGEKDRAFYFAKKASILGKAAYYRIQERNFRWQYLEENLQEWKTIVNSNEKDQAYQEKIFNLQKEIHITRFNSAMTESKMEKVPKYYRLVLKDMDLFHKMNVAVWDNAVMSLEDFYQMIPLALSQKLIIESHTSGQDKDYAVSNVKASAFKTFLVGMGLSADQIEIAAKGNEKPLLKNNQPVKGQLNDRLELNFGKGEPVILQDRFLFKNRKWQIQEKGKLALSEGLKILPIMADRKISLQGVASALDPENYAYSKTMVLKDYLIKQYSLAEGDIQLTLPKSFVPAQKGAKPVQNKPVDQVQLTLQSQGKTIQFALIDREIYKKAPLSFQLSESGRQALEQIQKNYGNLKSKINLEAHTSYYDPKNTDSLKKIQAIQNYWIEKGLPQGSLMVVPMGNKKPLIFEGRAVKGIDNERISVSFENGALYRLILKDEMIFQKGNFSLSESGKKPLEKIVQLMALAPKTKVQIETYTSRIDKGYSISKKKSAAIKDYLMGNAKIPAESIVEFFIGSDSPVLMPNGKTGRGKENDALILLLDIPRE